MRLMIGHRSLVMPMVMPLVVGLSLIMGLLSGPSGCTSDPTQGYAAMSVFPTNFSTVFVPIFENETYFRNMEYDLTDALVKEIEARTPYRMASESRADTMLSGKIVKVELDQLSKSQQTGLSEESVLQVTIDFEWKDLRTGRAMIVRRNFAGFGLFVPSQPTGEPIELGRFSAVQQLARDIVNELQADW
ncbi:MAG: LptE family protein [Planctomycetota bacterium]|nr:LptE family protein [Planctomycetota bacterium]